MVQTGVDQDTSVCRGVRAEWEKASVACTRVYEQHTAAKRPKNQVEEVAAGGLGMCRPFSQEGGLPQ